MIRLKPNSNFRITVHILLVSKRSGQVSSFDGRNEFPALLLV
jgi:hypothetical protein